MTNGSLVALAVATLAASACVIRPTQFDRYFTDRQWTAAAREFESDTALRHNEEALYRAGLVYGTPGFPTYNLARSRELLTLLVSRFPNSAHSADATARLLLIDDVTRARRDADQRERDLEGRIAALTREVSDLKSRLDAIAPQSDSLRNVITRLEADRRDRDEQIRALRSELTRLKEIDLRPRPIKPSR